MTPRSRFTGDTSGVGLAGEHGYVMALFALLLLPIMAFTSMAVDLGAWYARSAQIQRAADAAALAGAPLLPDMTKATAAAQTTLAKNGFTASSTIQITYSKVNNTQMRVTLKDLAVPQYFSSMFRSSVDVERKATAEKIKPVPMGSPRNFLGTGTKQSGAARENFWLSVSGYCAKNEMGDRITPRADRNGSGSNHTCTPGSPSYVRSNDEYSADGYYYAIEFPNSVSGSYKIDLFDAPHCQFEGSGAGDSGAHQEESAREYTFTVRSNNSNDPALSTPLFTQTLTPDNCASNGTWRNTWKTLYTLNNPTAGTYYLQVKPVIPTDKTGQVAQEGQNQFGLRVYSGTYAPCSNDPTALGAPVTLNANCPKVYALTHLGVYAAFSGSSPSFYLASVGAEHAGKVMELEMFDPAEGANGIELLDPNGNPANFTWEIGCKDGTYRSESGNCTTGESAPSGGYGPGTGTYKDVSGNGTKPWSELTQSGKYSDRLLRFRVDLPTNYAAIYGANTWWRVRYTVCSGDGCSVGDRTTWTVRIKGDPVRLVPNS